MGTDSLTTEQIAAAQSKQIADLQAQLARLHDRLGPDPEAAPAVQSGYPRIVYRAQDEPNPKQIDHPGWDALRVDSEVAHAEAIAAGWQDAPGAFVYPPEVEEPVARKASGKKK